MIMDFWLQDLNFEEVTRKTNGTQKNKLNLFCFYTNDITGSI